MTEIVTLEPHGVLVEPATLKIERLLPGPIERCWAWITESELRRKWLAAGEMTLAVGAPFELVWRNGELNDPPSPRPPGFSEEHRLQSRILALDPPRLLVITWGQGGEVSFELQPKGSQVLLTLIHSRVPDRGTLLNVSAGWHMHLEMLLAQVHGRQPPAFWEGWQRLKQDYDARLPA
ncbi:SRPBCC family protein [Falsiroseomonas sp.]|uniref:SRPBCC family protein n=1 Tax=Falsiroseomonas sp. TaxID=2870721 RepID=UPI00271769AE|nr:SRPBCC family protein [Falsiroseomonas sp.]MDO9501951.1 SRPBCC family protein [Falsiroseomonas sp.]